MKSQSLVHDVIFNGVRACLQVVAGVIRDDEHKDVFEAFCEVLRKSLERYDEMLEKLNTRLRPSAN